MLLAAQAIWPAVAFEFTLNIYGNANMDGAIDDSDKDLLEEIIAVRSAVRCS